MTKKLYLTHMELREFTTDEWIYKGLFEKDIIRISLNRNFISEIKVSYGNTLINDNKLYLSLYNHLSYSRYTILN